MPEINDDEPDGVEPPGKPDAGTESEDTDPEGADASTFDGWDADGEFDGDEGESDVADAGRTEQTDAEGDGLPMNDGGDDEGDYDDPDIESDVAETNDDSIDRSNRWPGTPEEMDHRLGFEGRRIPDGPDTQGRNKVEWKPSSEAKIVYEEHPYDTGAPEWHRGPHWHMDYPGTHHKRCLPGDPL